MLIHFILFISIKSILSSVIIPFKNYIQENLNRNIFENLYITKITSTLKIGTPLQEIELYIQLQDDNIIILNSDSKYCSSKIKCFNSKVSETFKTNDKEEYDVNLPQVESAKRSTDKLDLNSETKINNVEFLLTNEILYKKSGILGLRMPDKKAQFNLIKQLKNKDIINSYIFFIYFPDKNNKYEGQIIIGEYPHDFNSKKYKKENMEKRQVSYTPTTTLGQDYIFECKKIFYGDELVVKEQDISFIFESELFRASFKLKEILEENFFNKYLKKNECEIKIYKETIIKNSTYIVCKNSIDISKMKPLKFQIEDYLEEIILTPEDLFLKVNNDLVFLIYFEDYWKMKWTFGYTFFRKYMVFFDQDSKMIGFYLEKKGQNGISIFTIFFCVFLFGVILFLAFNIYQLIKRKKKIKAKELIEDLLNTEEFK
jgi:hypothetical protein